MDHRTVAKGGTMASKEVRTFVARYGFSARHCILAAALCCLTGPLDANAGKPTKPPGPGGSPPTTPDIVYMSKDNRSVTNNAEVRGGTLSANGLSSTDGSLLKSANGREYTSIAWAPDGSRFAWVENGAIMTAVPGKAPTVLYSTTPGDGKPTVAGDYDGLAWGLGCTGGTSLAFTSWQPYGIHFLPIDGSGVHAPIPLVTFVDYGGAGQLAFSPSGQHLAFVGGGDTLPGDGIHLIPMCTFSRTPFLLVSSSDVSGTGRFASVMSVDWSRHGDRLALSVTTGPDPNYPWRDLKIVELKASSPGGSDAYSYAGIWTVDLDDLFTAESSEHSPQWGPTVPGEACQRIAFSQSSDIAPRSLYLLDINDGYVGGCQINAPLKLAAKNPRALDWK
jgi:hypothetical protein